MTRLFFVVAVLALLPGCAQRLYEWNNYDGSLYRYYKEPNSAEAFRASMEAHLNALEERKLRPAPGLYAELGTLYLERGDRLTAARYYEKERDAWPESRHLMDTMLAVLRKPTKGAEPK
jgi:hypothetical protein